MTELAEPEAWAYLATGWESPIVSSDYGYAPHRWTGYAYAYITIGGVDCIALCESVDALRATHRISHETRSAMRAMIDRSSGIAGRYAGFYWPTHPDGAKKRAAFCRRQAVVK